MKLGLDVHGVIDKEPMMFSIVSNFLVNYNHEVHIITGSEITDKLKKQLQDFNIRYTHLFSIVSYHKSIGTLIRYEDNGPWIDEEVWNKTKAEYCKSVGINLHIDDSEIYGRYFPEEITYLLMKGEAVTQDPENKFMNLITKKCKIPTCSAPVILGNVCRQHFLSEMNKAMNKSVLPELV